MYACTLADNNQDAQVTGNVAIDALIPARGSKTVVRQSEVGADLSFEYTGVLSINGIQIPDEQLVADNGLNRIVFKPSAGKVISALDSSTNCAEIVVWRVTDGPGAALPPIRWCFEAL